MSFHLNIVSLKGKIFSGEVEKVILPAESGGMTVLSDHMPIVSPLKMGEVKVKGEEDLQLVIGKGIFTFSNNNAELLVEDVSSSEDISEEKALKAKKRAEETLKEVKSKEDRLKAKYHLKRSLIELEIAKKNNKKAQSS